MRRDFLHELIASLGSLEVPYFKATNFFTSGKWGRERMLLLDILRTDGQHVNERLQAKLGNSPYLKIQKKERFRMTRALMAHLLLCEQQGQDVPDPWRHFEEARLLLNRGLPPHAADRAVAGIGVAEQVHDLHAQLALREQLRVIYKLMPRGELSKEITDNEYRLETVAQQVVNLTRYTTISDRLSDLQKRYRIADDTTVRSAMDGLMADELMSDMRYAISLPAQIRFASIRAYHAQCAGELEKAVEHLSLCAALWESSADRIAYLPHLYREALANLVSLLVLTGELDRVPILLKRMELVQVTGHRARMLAFCDTELQYQLYYMNTGRFDEVMAREEAVNKGIRHFAGLLLESKELTLLYNLGIAHLITGSDGPALGYFDRIRDKGRLDSRIDLQSIARIFRILLLLENNDTGSFTQYLRINRSTFRRHMPTYRMMETVYKWLGSHQNDYYSPDRVTFLKELHNALEPFEKDRTVGAEEIRLWAMSRMKGVTMHTLLGTKGGG